MTNINPWTTAALALVSLALSAPAPAQTMYRCGKQYQDRPCDAGQQGRAVGSATSGQPGVPATSDAECAQRGSDAVKFVWAREAGATAERQTTDIDAKPVPADVKAYEKSIVAEVYRRRGTAPEIRAAIQADCVAEKEKRLFYGQGAAPAPAAAPATSGPGEDDLRIAEERRRQAHAERAEERRKRTCAGLNESLEANRADARAGGSASRMDSLRARERSLQSRMRENGC